MAPPAVRVKVIREWKMLVAGWNFISIHRLRFFCSHVYCCLIGYQFSCLIMTTVSISTARHGFKFCLVYSSLIFSQQSTWDTRMPVFDSWWTCGSLRLIKNNLEYHLLYSNETAERRGSRAKGKEIEHWLNVQPFLEQEEKIST